MNSNIIPVTPRLLNLVVAVMRKREQVIAEAAFSGADVTWHPIVAEYVHSLPIETVGLCKNDHTIRTLVNGAESDDLDQASATEPSELAFKFGFNSVHGGVVALSCSSHIATAACVGAQRLMTSVETAALEKALREDGVVAEDDTDPIEFRHCFASELTPDGSLMFSAAFGDGIDILCHAARHPGQNELVLLGVIEVCDAECIAKTIAGMAQK